MMFIYKNKGILVPIYVFVSFVGVFILKGLLAEYLGGLFLIKIDHKLYIGIIFIISGLWTYITRDEYMMINERKVRVGYKNSFFYISTKIWSYIFYCVGLIMLVVGLMASIKGSEN